MTALLLFLGVMIVLAALALCAAIAFKSPMNGILLFVLILLSAALVVLGLFMGASRGPFIALLFAVCIPLVTFPIWRWLLHR